MNEKVVTVRMNEASHQLLKAAAAESGLSLNAFCLWKIGLPVTRDGDAVGCPLDLELSGEGDRDLPDCSVPPSSAGNEESPEASP